MKEKYKITRIKDNKILLTRLPNPFEQSVGFLILFFLVGWLLYLVLYIVIYILIFILSPIKILYRFSPKLIWFTAILCVTTGLYFVFQIKIHNMYHYQLGKRAIDSGKWQDGIDHLTQIKAVYYADRNGPLLEAYENLFVNSLSINDKKEIAFYAMKIDGIGELSSEYKKIIKNDKDILNIAIDLSDSGIEGYLRLTYDDRQEISSDNIKITRNKVVNNSCGGNAFYFMIENTGSRPRNFQIIEHAGDGELWKSNTLHPGCYEIKAETIENIIFTLNPGDIYSVAYRHIPDENGEYRTISIISGKIMFSWPVR